MAVASAAAFTRAFRLAFRPGFVGFRRSFCSRGRTPGNRDLDVNNPVFQAVIGPFVVAFLVVGVSRLVVWPTGSEVLGGLGLAAGLLMAFVQLRGIPSLPPNSAPEKLFYLITLGGLIARCPRSPWPSGPHRAARVRSLSGNLPRLVRPTAVVSGSGCLAADQAGCFLMWAGAAIVLWQICVATARCGGSCRRHSYPRHGRRRRRGRRACPVHRKRDAAVRVCPMPPSAGRRRCGPMV